MKDNKNKLMSARYYLAEQALTNKLGIEKVLLCDDLMEFVIDKEGFKTFKREFMLEKDSFLQIVKYSCETNGSTMSPDNLVWNKIHQQACELVSSCQPLKKMIKERYFDEFVTRDEGFKYSANWTKMMISFLNEDVDFFTKCVRNKLLRYHLLEGLLDNEYMKELVLTLMGLLDFAQFEEDNGESEACSFNSKKMSNSKLKDHLLKELKNEYSLIKYDLAEWNSHISTYLSKKCLLSLSKGFYSEDSGYFELAKEMALRTEDIYIQCENKYQPLYVHSLVQNSHGQDVLGMEDMVLLDWLEMNKCILRTLLILKQTTNIERYLHFLIDLIERKMPETQGCLLISYTTIISLLCNFDDIDCNIHGLLGALWDQILRKENEDNDILLNKFCGLMEYITKYKKSEMFIKYALPKEKMGIVLKSLGKAMTCDSEPPGIVYHLCKVMLNIVEGLSKEDSNPFLLKHLGSIPGWNQFYAVMSKKKGDKPKGRGRGKGKDSKKPNPKSKSNPEFIWDDFNSKPIPKTKSLWGKFISLFWGANNEV